MLRARIIFLVLAAATLLGGCESANKAFSGGKIAPDEFVVYSRPPLSLPPEYNLRPPQPGAARPQRVPPSTQAQAAILGKSAESVVQTPEKMQGSPGIQALLQQTGSLRAEPSIRNTINKETSVLAEEDRRFVDKLIFWVDNPPDPSTVVDAEKEQKRILGTQALGKPINEGETPAVKRKRKKKNPFNF